MSNASRGAWRHHWAESMATLYPIFSRRATQVCILSSALERIEAGEANPRRIAAIALTQANPFDWVKRSAGPLEPREKT
jgi:hypothetical protein